MPDDTTAVGAAVTGVLGEDLCFVLDAAICDGVKGSTTTVRERATDTSEGTGDADEGTLEIAKEVGACCNCGRGGSNLRTVI